MASSLVGLILPHTQDRETTTINCGFGQLRRQYQRDWRNGSNTIH